MARDIDYAAVTVRAAITEKYGQQTNLADLEVEPGETTISVRQAGRVVEGTRDNLLASVRKSSTFAEFWELFPASGA